MNNREIKFRGYSKNINKWVFGDLINTPEKGHRIIWFEYKGESQFDLDYDSFNEVVETKSIGQYTGLTDKNGVEIYEGDIVTYYNKYSDKTYTHIVKWDALWSGFGLFEKDNQWCKESDWVKITYIEVIGNIYETPELISK